MTKLQLFQKLICVLVLVIPSTSSFQVLWFLPLRTKMPPTSQVTANRNTPIFGHRKIQDADVKTEHPRLTLQPLELFEHHADAKPAWKEVTKTTFSDPQMIKIAFYYLHCSALKEVAWPPWDLSVCRQALKEGM